MSIELLVVLCFSSTEFEICLLLLLFFLLLKLFLKLPKFELGV